MHKLKSTLWTLVGKKLFSNCAQSKVNVIGGVRTTRTYLRTTVQRCNL